MAFYKTKAYQLFEAGIHGMPVVTFRSVHIEDDADKYDARGLYTGTKTHKHEARLEVGDGRTAWRAIQQCHKFDPVLENEQMCEEIVCIRPSGHEILCWRSGSDAQMLPHFCTGPRGFQGTECPSEGDVFELRFKRQPEARR